MRRVLLRSRQSPGDILMLTAAVRDLHAAHPQQFETDVRTSAEAIWEYNPRLTKLSERDRDVEVIDMHYPLIHESNQKSFHFIHGYVQYLEQKFGLSIPVTKFRGEIFLADEERQSPFPGHELPEQYWILMAGGKYDFTAKWWNPASYQKVVDHFQGKLAFVQCGEAGHWHPPLEGVINLIGKTSTRQFIRLMHHAAGVVCPVTFAMHLAAAVETLPGRSKSRPCVVIAGGREPTQWEAYPQHQYISTVGALSCCEEGGCWKSRCQLVGDGDEKDRRDLCEQPVQITPDLRIPRCLEMITPERVIDRIEMYLDGMASRTPAAKPAIRETVREAITPREATAVVSNGHQTETRRSVAVAATTNGHAPVCRTPAVNGRRPVGGGTAVAMRPAPPQRAPVAPRPAAPPPAPRKHRVLIEFRHGLGDAAQLTVLLRHLKHYHPGWEIDLAAPIGKQTVGRGLCNQIQVLNTNARRSLGYAQVFNLDWDECREAHADYPSTKPTRCLRDVFKLEPRLELYGYQIERTAAVDQRARDYLASICPRGPLANGRFPAVLIHYQGNTSCDRKDLPHEVAIRICETVRELGYVPVILDWDNRSPLIDHETVHCPQAGHEVWGGGHGTGDAESIAALTEASALLIGIDSGPLHVAGATTTPTLGVWTRHHPVHFFDLCANVKHLVPEIHPRLANGSAAVEFFTKHYNHQVYRNLSEEVAAEIRRQLGGEVPATPVASTPTATAPTPPTATAKPQRILTSTEYNRQYYEEHQKAGLDYLNFGDWQQRYGRWFVESLGFEGKRVLDVGCACGSILRGLGQARAIVEGFDLCEHMIELGRNKWPDMAPLLHVADAASLPQYGNESWEAIHSAQVAEHWEPEAVPKILRELARITVPGGLFFCSLDTEELFARQGRDMAYEDPTHICVKPRAWWTEQLAKAGWTDVTSEYEPALLDHPDSFLKKYDWDYFVARKEPQGLPDGPYDLERYPAEIWAIPMGNVDRRHLNWMFDVLTASGAKHALEIGCLNGASSTAFVEAINRGQIDRTTFCDIHFRETFRRVLERASDPSGCQTFEGRSIDLLAKSTEAFDFVFVDGDHTLDTVAAEVEALIAKRPRCVMAHDTNLQALGYGASDGPPYLKWRFQTAPGYFCLEDSVVRPGEETGRGMFLATTSLELFEAAQASLAKWGRPTAAAQKPTPNATPILPQPRANSVGAEDRITVMCASSGRPTLRRALQSLQRQTWKPGDEVWLIHDGPAEVWVSELWSELGLPGRFVEMPEGPHGDWGHTPRNRYLPEVPSGYVVNLDDDDALAPFAIATVREATLAHPNQCFMFRADYPKGKTLGFVPEMKFGNVSTGQFVHPACLDLGEYTPRYGGDFDFITTTLEKNPGSKLVWRAEAINLARPHDDNRNPNFSGQKRGTRRDRSHTGWQIFFGNWFQNREILEVGTGLGLSKHHLSLGGNRVTTFEVTEKLAERSSGLADSCFEVVTALNTIERFDNDSILIEELIRIARDAVVITTPNVWVSNYSSADHVREYTPALLLELLSQFSGIRQMDLFVSSDLAGADPVSLSPSQFLGTEMPALGVVLWKRTATPEFHTEPAPMGLDHN